MTSVLVTYGSRRGGTAEIAQAIARSLREQGFDVDCEPAASVRSLSRYHAAIIGGALYMRLWPREARRFVRRHAEELRRIPVWMFSSGPLDDTANRRSLPPVPQVASLIALVRARGHVTFGGRLTRDAKGLVASQMAKTRAGDWRDWDQIETWSRAVGSELGTAQREPIPTSARAPEGRWLLAAVCWFVGLTALAGGALLVARPDGSLLGMTPSLLAYSPFESFLVPGLLLFGVIGIGSVLAGMAVARGSPASNFVAFMAGMALVVWTVVQMISLRTTNWLQLSYLAVALVILVLAVVAERHEDVLQYRPA